MEQNTLTKVIAKMQLLLESDCFLKRLRFLTTIFVTILVVSQCQRLLFSKALPSNHQFGRAAAALAISSAGIRGMRARTRPETSSLPSALKVQCGDGMRRARREREHARARERESGRKKGGGRGGALCSRREERECYAVERERARERAMCWREREQERYAVITYINIYIHILVNIYILIYIYML